MLARDGLVVDGTSEQEISHSMLATLPWDQERPRAKLVSSIRCEMLILSENVDDDEDRDEACLQLCNP